MSVDITARYMYTKEYYSAIKKEIMPFAAVSVYLEITILRKRKANTI